LSGKRQRWGVAVSAVKSKFDTDAQAKASCEKQNICCAGLCHKRVPAIAIVTKTIAAQVNFEGFDIV
jgi:hypothetical protein